MLPLATKWKKPRFDDFTEPGGTFLAWYLSSITPAKKKYAGSYGMNYLIIGSGYDRYVLPQDGDEHWITTNAKNSGRVPVILDSAYPWIPAISTFRPPPSDAVPEATQNPWYCCINRHEGCINGLFMDWSVRKIGLKELWALKWGMNWDTAGPWTKAGGIKPEDWPEWMRRFKDY